MSRPIAATTSVPSFADSFFAPSIKAAPPEVLAIVGGENRWRQKRR